MNDACLIRVPARQTLPLVFSSPHSGSVYPTEFLRASRLDAAALRRSEDAHVDSLIAGVVDQGAPMVAACFPRAYLDVNREPYELDPRMFDGRLPAWANTTSLRVAGGLGTIPRIVGEYQEIYGGRLPAAEALRRIDRFYRPYHDALRRLTTATLGGFGIVVLVDCHSMPSAAVARSGERRVDVVLGDRFGTSCGPMLVDTVERALIAAGLSVARNKPYAGGFITEHYGQPALRRHALQIEVDRALYMNETTLEPHAGFGSLSSTLADVFARLGEATTHLLDKPRWAAE